MKAYLNNNQLDWKDRENFLLLTLTFRIQYTGRKLCKSLSLLVLVGFVVCGFVFISLVGLGFLGDDAGREAIQHQHLCKIKSKAETLQGKDNISREKHQL